MEEKPRMETEMSHSQVDISNFKRCIEDSKRVFLDSDRGPEDPTDYNKVKGKDRGGKKQVPALYRQIDVEPFIKKLNEIGESGFIKILLRDPQRERTAGLMLDIAHAILQNGERYPPVGLMHSRKLSVTYMTDF